MIRTERRDNLDGKLEIVMEKKKKKNEPRTETQREEKYISGQRNED